MIFRQHLIKRLVCVEFQRQTSHHQGSRHKSSKRCHSTQSQKTQGFCVADFATLSDETRSRSKIFPLFIWIKEPCVRKFERLERSKLLGISQNKLFRLNCISPWAKTLKMRKDYTPCPTKIYYAILNYWGLLIKFYCCPKKFNLVPMETALEKDTLYKKCWYTKHLRTTVPLVSYIRNSLRFWCYDSLSTCCQNLEKKIRVTGKIWEKEGVKLLRDLTEKTVNFSTLATSNIRLLLVFGEEDQ